MELSGKKVIVFGGGGFIGRHLCETLVERGAEVTAFDRELSAVPESVRCIQGDFFDERQLAQAIQGQDMIVHAICTINPGSSVERYMQGYEKDFVQSARLCDVAFRQGKRLLFLSSGGTVYASKNRPLVEDDPKKPINHYGSLKLCVENMMQAFMHAGADFRIARIANAYGPGQDYRKGVGFVDAAIKKAMRGETIEIWGDGNIVRDYIYIDDICHMLCDVLAHDGEVRVFNIGTGEGVSQRQVVEVLKEHIPGAAVNFLPGRTVDKKETVLDIACYKKKFSFTPRNFSEGFQKYFVWLSNQ